MKNSKKYIIKVVGYDMWVVDTKLNDETLYLMPMLTVFRKNATEYAKNRAEEIVNILNYQAKYEKYILKEVEL